MKSHFDDFATALMTSTFGVAAVSMFVAVFFGAF